MDRLMEQAEHVITHPAVGFDPRQGTQTGWFPGNPEAPGGPEREGTTDGKQEGRGQMRSDVLLEGEAELTRSGYGPDVTFWIRESCSPGGAYGGRGASRPPEAPAVPSHKGHMAGVITCESCETCSFCPGPSFACPNSPSLSLFSSHHPPPSLLVTIRSQEPYSGHPAKTPTQGNGSTLPMDTRVRAWVGSCSPFSP